MGGSICAMNAAVEIPIRDNRRQAKFLYWMGWRVCDIADHLGEKDKTLHSWKDRDGWDRADSVERIGGPGSPIGSVDPEGRQDRR